MDAGAWRRPRPGAHARRRPQAMHRQQFWCVACMRSRPVQTAMSAHTQCSLRSSRLSPGRVPAVSVKPSSPANLFTLRRLSQTHGCGPSWLVSVWTGCSMRWSCRRRSAPRRCAIRGCGFWHAAHAAPLGCMLVQPGGCCACAGCSALSGVGCGGRLCRSPPRHAHDPCAACMQPNPVIFEEALARLQLRPHEVLHVGDDRRNDIW